MTDSFDAYYKWLGIPPEEQPPDYYRLLGIRLFEENTDVIRASADWQLVHLGTYNSGEHADLAKKLIKEVVSARDCLLQADRRTKYDRELRRKSGSSRPDDPQATFVDPVPPAPPKPPEPPVVDAEPVDRERPAEEKDTGEDEDWEAPFEHESDSGTSISTNVALHKLFDATDQKKGKRHNRSQGGDGDGQVVPARETRARLATHGRDVESGDGSGGVRIFQEPRFLILAGGVVVVLLVFLLLALSGGSPEVGVLVFDWPIDQRRDVSLEIDGKAVEFPAKGSLKYECPAGEHAIAATRPRYQSFTTEDAPKVATTEGDRHASTSRPTNVPAVVRPPDLPPPPSDRELEPVRHKLEGILAELLRKLETSIRIQDRLSAYGELKTNLQQIADDRAERPAMRFAALEELKQRAVKLGQTKDALQALRRQSEMFHSGDPEAATIAVLQSMEFPSGRKIQGPMRTEFLDTVVGLVESVLERLSQPREETGRTDRHQVLAGLMRKGLENYPSGEKKDLYEQELARFTAISTIVPESEREQNQNNSGQQSTLWALVALMNGDIATFEDLSSKCSFEPLKTGADLNTALGHLDRAEQLNVRKGPDKIDEWLAEALEPALHKARDHHCTLANSMKDKVPTTTRMMIEKRREDLGWKEGK